MAQLRCVNESTGHNNSHLVLALSNVNRVNIFREKNVKKYLFCALFRLKYWKTGVLIRVNRWKADWLSPYDEVMEIPISFQTSLYKSNLDQVLFCSSYNECFIHPITSFIFIQKHSSLGTSSMMEFCQLMSSCLKHTYILWSMYNRCIHSVFLY